MRIALIQLSASLDRSMNLDRVLVAMEEAARQEAQLVAFPELAVDRFFPQWKKTPDTDALHRAEPIPGPTTDRVAAKARELGLVTVFNLYERAEDGLLYDSSPVFDADGTLLGVTRMLHITEYPRCHEQDYYTPGDTGAPVYQTRYGKVGVAICYDRHYPEVMRALGVAGAELVVIPQAGWVGEWADGMFEAEIRVAAFQNGYFAALCNRVGREDELHFSGESFVVAPDGTVVTRGARLEEALVLADLDLSAVERSTARRLFLRHRRPGIYGDWLD